MNRKAIMKTFRAICHVRGTAEQTATGIINIGKTIPAGEWGNTYPMPKEAARIISKQKKTIEELKRSIKSYRGWNTRYREEIERLNSNIIGKMIKNGKE
jgi:hypothetical protein